MVPVLVEPAVPEEPAMPVEGLDVEGTVDEDELGVLTVSSVFLLQPPSASAAAKASATAQADLSECAYISISFSKKWERLKASQL
jgi:hypothetical protein